MKTNTWAAGGLALFGALLAAQTSSANEIAWKTSLKSALQAAKKSDQIVMIDFYTDWCGWCKKLDEDTYSNRKVIEAAGKMISVKLDAENGEGKPAAAKYKVRGFPTILFLDSSGGVVGKVGGYMPPEPFMKKLTQIQKDHQELAGLLEKTKSGSVDAASAARLASIYANRDDLKSAAQWVGVAEKEGADKAKLAPVYNSLGDAYQESEQFDKAIAQFRKAISGAADPNDKVYAYHSITACLASQEKFDDALVEAQNAEKVQGVSEASKKQSQLMVSRLREFQKRAELAKKKGKGKAPGQQAN
jgi:thioredoxin-related protein